MCKKCDERVARMHGYNLDPSLFKHFSTEEKALFLEDVIKTVFANPKEAVEAFQVVVTPIVMRVALDRLLEKIEQGEQSQDAGVAYENVVDSLFEQGGDGGIDWSKIPKI